MIALKPAYLKRYKDLAWLLYKYGGSDLVHQSGLSDAVGDSTHSSSSSPSPPAITNGQPVKPLPEQLADDLESLGPAFVKLGQLLSTRPDILPEPYLDALSRLQDHGKPAPWVEIQRILQEEFETDPDRIFDEFDREPIAAASLGQVYRATLHDGRKVIVKVQRPGIIEPLESDLAAFAEISRVLHDHTELGRHWQIKPLVETLTRTIASELDYRREAHDSHVLGQNLREFDRLMIPQAIDSLTRRRVLTMERVEGTKITEVSPLVLVDMGHEELVGQLFKGYLRQVFVDGIFHSDPHPGNLMLTIDGRIALLDFGMITRVSTETRLKMVKLVLAVCHGDGEETARITESLGERTPLFKRGEFCRRIGHLVASQQDLAVQQMGTGRTIMNVLRTAGETGIVVPESLLMLGKTLMNLDKAVAVLDPKFNPTAAVREQAAEMVKNYSLGRFSLNHFYEAVLNTTDLLQTLPGRINTVTRRLADNELEIKVRTIDEVKFI
ncbi:MAG TPA: AarF/UbiB family protein, partial [Planctomycetaceae bacterium]